MLDFFLCKDHNPRKAPTKICKSKRKRPFESSNEVYSDLNTESDKSLTKLKKSKAKTQKSQRLDLPPKSKICPTCGKTFSNVQNMRKHHR